MFTDLLNMVSRFLLAVVRFWVSVTIFVACFVFIPMVLFWLVFFVIYAERSGLSPFWR